MNQWFPRCGNIRRECQLAEGGYRMICDDCGKKEAVVHIVQIGPNGRVEKNLC